MDSNFTEAARMRKRRLSSFAAALAIACGGTAVWFASDPTSDADRDLPEAIATLQDGTPATLPEPANPGDVVARSSRPSLEHGAAPSARDRALVEAGVWVRVLDERGEPVPHAPLELVEERAAPSEDALEYGREESQRRLAAGFRDDVALPKRVRGRTDTHGDAFFAAVDLPPDFRGSVCARFPVCEPRCAPFRSGAPPLVSCEIRVVEPRFVDVRQAPRDAALGHHWEVGWLRAEMIPLAPEEVRLFTYEAGAGGSLQAACDAACVPSVRALGCEVSARSDGGRRESVVLDLLRDHRRARLAIQEPTGEAYLGRVDIGFGERDVAFETNHEGVVSFLLRENDAPEEPEWLTVRRLDENDEFHPGDANEAYVGLESSAADSATRDLGVARFGHGPIWFDGIVVEPDGRAVSGAVLRLYDTLDSVDPDRIRCDEQGRFRRNGLSWRQGQRDAEIWLELETPGFVFEEERLLPSSASGRDMRLVAHRSSRPRVAVRMPQELANAGPAVELRCASRTVTRKCVQENLIDFGDVPPGPAELLVTCDGVTIARDEVTLVEGVQKLVPLELHVRVQRVAFEIRGAGVSAPEAAVGFETQESGGIYYGLRTLEGGRLVLFAPAEAREAALTYGGRTVSAVLPRLEPIVLEARR